MERAAPVCVCGRPAARRIHSRVAPTARQGVPYSERCPDGPQALQHLRCSAYGTGQWESRVNRRPNAARYRGALQSALSDVPHHGGPALRARLGPAGASLRRAVRPLERRLPDAEAGPPLRPRRAVPQPASHSLRRAARGRRGGNVDDDQCDARDRRTRRRYCAGGSRAGERFHRRRRRRRTPDPRRPARGSSRGIAPSRKRGARRPAAARPSMVTMASNRASFPDLVDLCAACGVRRGVREELYSHCTRRSRSWNAREHLGNLALGERRDSSRRRGSGRARQVSSSHARGRVRASSEPGRASLPTAGSRARARRPFL